MKDPAKKKSAKRKSKSQKDGSVFIVVNIRTDLYPKRVEVAAFGSSARAQYYRRKWSAENSSARLTVVKSKIF